MSSPSGSLEFLNRRLYSISEAARLLRIRSSKLRRWLEGYERRGMFYQPVIRTERTGAEDVTWAEFVEAGWLAEYRVDIPLQRMRRVIEALREEFNAPYPLAYFRPLVDEATRELVFRAQELADVEDDLFLIRRIGQSQLGGWQFQWAEPVVTYLRKVEFDPDGVIRRIRPQESEVVIDPDIEFGIPQIKGVRTETLAEAFATGHSIEEISSTGNLTANDIHAALRWEFLISREALDRFRLHQFSAQC